MIYSPALKKFRQAFRIMKNKIWTNGYWGIFLWPTLRPCTRNGVDHDIQILADMMSNILPSYPRKHILHHRTGHSVNIFVPGRRFTILRRGSHMELSTEKGPSRHPRLLKTVVRVHDGWYSWWYHSTLVAFGVLVVCTVEMMATCIENLTYISWGNLLH
jgi:hypothetical protein